MLLLAVAQQALLQLDSFSPQEVTNMASHSSPAALICDIMNYMCDYHLPYTILVMTRAVMTPHRLPN